MSISQTQSLNKFVRAGAGAGKTWNLTREVIRFAENYYSQNQKWPRIVLTTFTRKATQELKERMLVYCLQEKPQTLEFVQSTSFLTITTMHGLLSLFLKRYGHGLGLSSSFKIIESHQSDFWRKQILKDMIALEEYPKSLERFEIYRILNHLKSYEKVFWHGSYRPAEIKDLEDLIKDNCNHLADQLFDLINQGESQVEGESWPRYFEYLKDTVTVLKSDHPWPLKREFLKSIEAIKKPVKSKKNSPMEESTYEALKKCLEKVNKFTIDEAYDPDLWPASVGLLKDFDQFAKTFLQRLSQKKIDEVSLEADDLEFFSLKLQQNKKNLTEQFSKDFEAWFIDEFQDTSPLQIKLLNQFMKGQSCYIVGDPQQSIYLFRGSRSEVFFEKNKEMLDAGAEVVQLSDNYRSTDQLLDFINDFFLFRGDHFSKMNAIKKSKATKPVVITQIQSQGKEAEAALLSQQISELLKEGVSPKEICILTRTHSDLEFLEKSLSRLGFPVLSHSSSQFYKRREILDALALLTLFLNPWDDYNLILLMRSPWLGLDDAMILEIIKDHKNNYWPEFKKYFLTQQAESSGRYLLDAFEVKETYGVGWVFRKTLLRLGMLDFTHRIDPTGRREANLWKLINLVEKTSREAGGSLLELARNGAQSFELEDLGDSGDASAPIEPNKINLMTIHASKGLQFGHVFIPFLNKKPQETTYQDFCYNEKRELWSMRLPVGGKNQFIASVFEDHYKNEMQIRESEESERVLYVAMTRAKDRLFLSWTGKPDKKSWGLMIEQFNLKHKNHPQVIFSTLNDCQEVAYLDESVQTQVRTPFIQSRDRFVMVNDLKPLKTLRVTQDFDTLMAQEAHRQKGVLLHRLFENLKTHSVERVKDLATLWLPEHQADVLKALDYVTHHPEIPLLEIIKKGEVEWAYQIEEAKAIKEGRIDLWCIWKDCLWIIDYKTGSPQHIDKAIEQLGEYQLALQKLLPWDKEVKKVALYPFSQKTVIHSHLN